MFGLFLIAGIVLLICANIRNIVVIFSSQCCCEVVKQKTRDGVSYIFNSG